MPVVGALGGAHAVRLYGHSPLLPRVISLFHWRQSLPWSIPRQSLGTRVKFNQLIENISPERKARIAQKTARIQQEMALNKLQQAFLQKPTNIYINH